MTTAECYATLRVRKDGVTSADVTARLGIQPTSAHEAGDARQGGPAWPRAMWSLSTSERGRGPLADHLDALLDLVEPARERIAALADEGFELDWFCFVGVPGIAGAMLPPATLTRLGSLPIALDLDIYAFASDEVDVDVDV